MKSLQQRHHISLQLPTSDGNSPVIFSGGNMVTYDRIGSFTVLFLEESAESNPSLLFFLERPAMEWNPSLFGAACYGWSPSLFFLLWAACYGWSPSLFFCFGQPAMDEVLHCLGSLLWMESFIVFLLWAAFYGWNPSLFGQPAMDGILHCFLLWAAPMV
ncbi:unnamed protein product [Cuscuta epithymum]|uniref:Uncharacterized protein n=1 Tax=Cuscuta epithymum TaxID=186058 RepID=A0AAV0E459_9ASTE|nr:unnamed protein product [Cuscuta epithymum]